MARILNKAIEKAKEPKRDSVEDFIEKKEGWKPGTKRIFDKALLHKDKESVRKLLPGVPPAYRVLFGNNIRSLLQ